MCRHPCKCRSWHFCRNRWDLRFVPADTGVNNRCAGFFHRLTELNHFLRGAAALNQIEH